MSKELLSWYKTHGRKTLPWRNTNDPYHIYLSEIMLQQTQVKTVLERFYFQFLDKFPTLESLANASQDDVLKAWEGLGYYTRARNLHKTAQIVKTTLPTTAKALEELPGIGKSTAHAIACFAFKESLPILDANVKRILYRYYKVKKANDKELWKMAYNFFNDTNAYDFNQAMMDLGATICTARNAKCSECPLVQNCLGKNAPEHYPEKIKRKKVPIRKPNILILQDENRFALFQNEAKLLGGLWAFKQSEEDVIKGQLLGEIKQTYSHFKLHANVYLVATKNKNLNWFTLDEIDRLALSGADRKVLALIHQLGESS